jgi:hypothetical protein
MIQLLMAAAMLCQNGINETAAQKKACIKELLNCVSTFSKPLDSLDYKTETLLDCYSGNKGALKRKWK